MAEEKKISERMLSDLTGNAVSSAQQQLGTLQPQYQQLQQKLADLQNQRWAMVNKGMGDDKLKLEQYGSLSSQVQDITKQLSPLQAQINAQQAIINDPSSTLSAQDRDFLKGARFGESILGDGLGRLGTDPTMMEMEKRFKSLSEGMSSQEMLARKEQALQSINESNVGAQRALQARLAQAGVKGNIAGSQMRDVTIAGLQQKANLERDLMLQQREAERAGLQDYAKFTGEIKKFDLGQAAKEKDVVLQAGMGLSQMGVSERAAQAQAEAERAAAAARSAAACFIINTKVKMWDGTEKNIQDLKVMDRLSTGAYVQIKGEGISDDFYIWNNILMTGTHPIMEDGKWLEAQYSKNSTRIDVGTRTVYNIYCDTHKIEVNGFIVGDFASLWTLGGFSAIINNYFKKLQKRGLRYFGRMVEAMGLGSTPKRVTAKLRNHNGERR